MKQDMPFHFSVYFHTQEHGQYLQQVVGSSDSGTLVEAGDLADLPPLNRNGTDVILLEYQENNPELDRWLENLAANPKGPAVFLFFQEISTNSLWKTLRLGAKECFTFPVKQEDFRQALNRLKSRAAPAKEHERKAQVISFLGCKGGIGTTFFTVNAASLLAQAGTGQVLAVDLDLRFGQLKYFFDTQPQHTIAEVIENLDRLDQFYLQTILHQIKPNLFILPAPARLEESEMVTSAHVEKIIRNLKEHLDFHWILMDCSHQLDEVTLKALELSDVLVLVTAKSIPALSNTKKLLELLNLLDLRGLQTELWVNLCENQRDVPIAEVESFLGRKVTGSVAFDHKQVHHSINEGKPLVEIAPRIPTSRDLKQLAVNIRKEEGSKNGKVSGWKRLQRLWKKG